MAIGSHRDVSKNKGILPPKWMVKIRVKPYKKLMIWGYHYFWKHPYYSSSLFSCFGKKMICSYNLPDTKGLFYKHFVFLNCVNVHINFLKWFLLGIYSASAAESKRGPSGIKHKDRYACRDVIGEGSTGRISE